eukprot:g4012.t1
MQSTSSTTTTETAKTPGRNGAKKKFGVPGSHSQARAKHKAMIKSAKKGSKMRQTIVPSSRETLVPPLPKSSSSRKMSTTKRAFGGCTPRFKVGAVGSMYRAPASKDVQTIVTPSKTLFGSSRRPTSNTSVWAKSATKNRFDGPGSYIASQRGEGRGESYGKSRSDFSNAKYSHSSSAATHRPSKQSSGRDGWLSTRKDEGEASHRLAEPRSDFDTKNARSAAASSFAAKSSRFDGPQSYVKKSSAPTTAAGLAHGDIAKSAKKGAVAMKREKHSRFSVYGNIYETARATDIEPLAVTTEKSEDFAKPSAVFCASDKTTNRDGWLKSSARNEDEEASHCLAEPRSDFDMKNARSAAASSFAAKSSRFDGPQSYVKKSSAPTTAAGLAHGDIAKSAKKGAVAMKREKHSRFSVYGNIYETARATDIEPLAVTTEKSEDFAKPSAVFCASDKTTNRDGWLKSSARNEDEEASHHLAEPRSDFDRTVDVENVAHPNAVFAGKTSRFDAAGSYLKQKDKHTVDAVGLVHENILRSAKNGVTKIKRGKHGRFSTVGGIYS